MQNVSSDCCVVGSTADLPVLFGRGGPVSAQMQLEVEGKKMVIFILKIPLLNGWMERLDETAD